MRKWVSMKRLAFGMMLLGALGLSATRAQAGVLAEKKKVDAFLEAEAKEPGAVKTPSGMIFRSLKPGDGPAPRATDRVQVHYEESFIDGTVFDSSIQRGEPTEFPLNAVINCWAEGLQRMKVGEKARLSCPPGIAYGDR